MNDKITLSTFQIFQSFVCMNDQLADFDHAVLDLLPHDVSL